MNDPQIPLGLRRRIQPAETRRLDRWREYELRKSEWQLSHKDATPTEYQQAMRRLAEECGV